jgi:hypothetical protein
MPKRCDVCGVEYTHRCWNTKYHSIIVEIENKNVVKKLIQKLGDGIDEGRKSAKALGRSKKSKSTTCNSSPRNIPRRTWFAGTLRLR